MADYKTDIRGYWMDVWIPSDTTDDVYKVSSHVERAAGRWLALTCTCKGFTNHGTCKHLAKSNAHTANIPIPKEVNTPPLRRGFNLHCGICGGYEFIIRPRPGEDGHDIICSACGRLYPL